MNSNYLSCIIINNISEHKLVDGASIVFYGGQGCTDYEAAKRVIGKAPYTYKNVKDDPLAKEEATVICKAFNRGCTVHAIVVNYQIDNANGKIVFIEPRRPLLRTLKHTISNLSLHTSIIDLYKQSLS